MFKLFRTESFWLQPWFLVFAIVSGQFYGVWWMSLAEPEPIYVPSSMIVAQVSDGFDIVITAPGLKQSLIRAAN